MQDPLVTPRPEVAEPTWTPVQRRLHEIWSALLGNPSLDIGTNLFAAGGTSLVAMQIVAKVNHAFDVRIPWPLILRNPSILAFSHVVEKHMSVDPPVHGGG